MSDQVDDQDNWRIRRFPLDTLYAPGQKFGPERYDERFAAVMVDLESGFRGITADENLREGLFPLRDTGLSLEAARHALVDLCNELDAQQRTAIFFPPEAPELRLWHGLFTRRLRHGVLVEEMTVRQRRLVDALLEMSLSPHGSRMVREIRDTSALIGDRTGLFKDFGADLYWLSIIGDPSRPGLWGFQLDGHHVNLNWIAVGDQLVMTPTFLGAEPTIVRSGPHRGIRLFQDEYADACALFDTLSPAQRAGAIVADELEPELFAGPFRDNLEIGYAGIPVAEMTQLQRDLVLKVVSDFAGLLPPGHGVLRLREIASYLDETFLAWIGALSGDPPFYFRVHSPVALIEYEHIFGVGLEGDEHSPRHVHTVVRTPNGNDYGRDLIRQHHEQLH